MVVATDSVCVADDSVRAADTGSPRQQCKLGMIIAITSPNFLPPPAHSTSNIIKCQADPLHSHARPDTGCMSFPVIQQAPQSYIDVASSPSARGGNISYAPLRVRFVVADGTRSDIVAILNDLLPRLRAHAGKLVSGKLMVWLGSMHSQRGSAPVHL